MKIPPQNFIHRPTLPSRYLTWYRGSVTWYLHSSRCGSSPTTRPSSNHALYINNYNSHSNWQLCTPSTQRTTMLWNCRPCALSATINAQDIEILINGALSSGLDSVINVINGTYNLTSRYCELEIYISSRADTIHMLVHGITYISDYVSLTWSRAWAGKITCNFLPVCNIVVWRSTRSRFWQRHVLQDSLRLEARLPNILHRQSRERHLRHPDGIAIN